MFLGQLGHFSWCLHSWSDLYPKCADRFESHQCDLTQNMQHIPRAVHSPFPCDPRCFDVPILDNDKYHYDGEDFLAFPKANGFALKMNYPFIPHVIGYETSDKRTYYDTNLFLQEWGFFGFLREICKSFDCSFDRGMFQEGETQRFATTKNLRYIVAKWELRKLELSNDEIGRRHDHIQDCIYEVGTQVKEALVKAERALDRTPDLSGWLRDRFVAIILSVLLLAESAQKWVSSDDESRFRKVERPLKPHSRPKTLSFLQIRLETAGWCPLEIKTLQTHSYHNVSFMILASSLDRRHLRRSHTPLPNNEAVCSCEIVDRETYKTIHAPPCEDCKSSVSTRRWTEIENVVKDSVESSLFPVLTITSSATGSETETSINIDAHNNNAVGTRCAYIAISHLWADGLGAQDGGRLPDCQLRRIQQLVDELVSEHSSSLPEGMGRDLPKPFPFWLDTICVPNSDDRLADLARASMTNIYRNAAAALVLDATVYNVDFTGEVPEISMARIAFSRWATRGWTFQESACASRVFFRFKDRNVDFSEIDELYFKNKARIAGLEAPTPSSPVDAAMQKFRMRGADHCYYTSYEQVRKALNWSKDEKNTIPHRVEQLWHRLQRRVVSNPGDEAFIIGGLLQNVENLDRILGPERMKTLFLSLPRLPVSMIFYPGRRYREVGSRWIPRTMLRSSGEAAENEWRWHSNPEDALEVTPNGLLISTKGVLLPRLPSLKETLSDAVLVEVKDEFYFLAGYQEAPGMLRQGLLSDKLALIFPPVGIGPQYPGFIPGVVLLASLCQSKMMQDAISVSFEKIVYAHQFADGVPIKKETFSHVVGTPIETTRLWCIG